MKIPEESPSGSFPISPRFPIAPHGLHVLDSEQALSSEQAERQRVALEYAENRAGTDHIRFLRLFWHAYDLADRTTPNENLDFTANKEIKTTSQESVLRSSLEPLTTRTLAENSFSGNLVAGSPPFYSIPEYVEGERFRLTQLIDRRASVFSGQPTQGMQDCVAVGSNGEWNCSGVVIGRRVVLTAGHCALSMASKLSICTAFNVQHHGPSQVREGDVVRHPQLDIAAILFDSDLGIGHLNIAPPNLGQIGSTAVLAGYGAIDSAGDYGFGTRRFGTVTLAIKDNDELVAGPGPTGQNGCFGDSGGPLYLSDGSNWLIAGVQSRLYNSAYCGHGSVFVRISATLGELKNIAQAKGLNFVL